MCAVFLLFTEVALRFASYGDHLLVCVIATLARGYQTRCLRSALKRYELIINIDSNLNRCFPVDMPFVQKIA
jgi:hypothetical protein